MRTREKKCILATRNKGKIREFQRLFSDIGLEVLSLGELESPPDVVEDGNSFHENAFKKARTIAEHYGILAVSDDSGLEVDVLGGAPGVHSARYAGEGATDQENNQKLLEALKGVDESGRHARFRCVMVAYRPDGKWIEAEGTLQGIITLEPRGCKGFGYDPIFYVPELGKTLAEISTDEKNRISHRANALKKLHKKLTELLEP